MNRKHHYHVLLAKQNPTQSVFVFKATAAEVLGFAEIDRAGRTKEGRFKGFQRHQIASHVSNIRDYLAKPKAVLPNAVVIAFLEGLKINGHGKDTADIVIDTSKGKPGYVVDGQQRLTALSQTKRKDFEIFVVGLHCADFNELRKQFILVNSARPLPKSLIYELLPRVKDLPSVLDARAFAAGLTESLNFDSRSSLLGAINTHTNPSGFIKDTAFHKVIISSSSDGAIRELSLAGEPPHRSFELVSNFYGAVQDVFPGAWHGHTPKTSRLVHGTGIVALGYVMEELYSKGKRLDRSSFRKGLEPLRGRTAWTSGAWRFGRNDVVPWDQLQNVSRHVVNLAHYLVARVRKSANNIDVRKGGKRKARTHA